MMYSDLFPMLPDAARCWIYVAERRLTEAEQAVLLDAMESFFEGWASHGRPVQGAAACVHDRFLVVSGQLLTEGTLSGCGIDASVHAVEEAAGRLGLTWASPLLVFYRGDDGTVNSLPRSAFKKLVADGTVTAETRVFDVSLTTLGQVRAGAFEKPAGASWHARVFRIPQFASSIRRTSLVLVLALLGSVSSATAQGGGYINQEAVADLLNHRAETLDDIPEVYYGYYRLASSSDNNVIARNTFYKILGNGDIDKGRARAELVQMINRRLMQTVNIGDTLIIPTEFDLDFRAYSPFPRYYTGGREFDKLFIMDKTIQAFASYEYGQLVRWGIINTGNPDESPTPNGRYNFNWREEYRVSSLSPPGEEWEMYWVVNFHLERGMHVHQYEMPTGGPMSHGCVRLVDADAEWLYNWADTWTTTSKSDGIGSSQARLLKQGTTVLVIGTEPTGKPQPFTYKQRYPVLKRVDLPVHPYDVPPGTAQQEHFDKRRAAGD